MSVARGDSACAYSSNAVVFAAYRDSFGACLQNHKPPSTPSASFERKLVARASESRFHPISDAMDLRVGRRLHHWSRDAAYCFAVSLLNFQRSPLGWRDHSSTTPIRSRRHLACRSATTARSGATRTARRLWEGARAQICRSALADRRLGKAFGARVL